MAMWDVTVPMVLSVRVEADTAEEAQDQAFDYGRWIDPTDEQLADYKADHESGVMTCGPLEFNGAAEMEIVR